METPFFEILAYEPTKLGMLCLRRRELLCEPGTIVTEVTLDHEFLMSSYLTASEKALSEIALQTHSEDPAYAFWSEASAWVTPLGPRWNLIEFHNARLSSFFRR